MRFFNMFRKLFAVNREVKAAKDRMNETLEIRKEIVGPMRLREKIEERRRASMPTLEEPVTNGNGGHA